MHRQALNSAAWLWLPESKYTQQVTRRRLVIPHLGLTVQLVPNLPRSENHAAFKDVLK